MAVKLRLNRIGTKKRPFYRIVAIDSKTAQNGSHIEILGTYDPHNLSIPQTSTEKAEKGLIQLKTDRVIHWLKNGAQPTPTVESILKRLKISKNQAA
jgi:small subunit ribosomal protein S16